jgi:hypothetical protein
MDVILSLSKYDSDPGHYQWGFDKLSLTNKATGIITGFDKLSLTFKMKKLST